MSQCPKPNDQRETFESAQRQSPSSGRFDNWEREDSGGARPARTSEAAGHAVERVSEVSDRLRSKLTEAASDGKRRVAEEIRAFGHAADAAAEKLQEEEHGKVGQYVRGICEQCDHAADYIEHKEPSELVDDAGRLARSNPALVLGAAALTGFAIGRFISATRPRERHQGMNRSETDFDRAGSMAPKGSMYSEGGL